MDVFPDELLFTQSSIKNTFKKPREGERIDDAVDGLLSGKIKVSDFPSLHVVSYAERLWCLDNRRLWVFKKAKVGIIRVKIVTYNFNPQFRQLIEGNPGLLSRILKRGYWPRVRGQCRTAFHPRVRSDIVAPGTKSSTAEKVAFDRPIPIAVPHTVSHLGANHAQQHSNAHPDLHPAPNSQPQPSSGGKMIVVCISSLFLVSSLWKMFRGR